MPIKLTPTLIPHGQEPSLSTMLGVSAERKEQLMELIKLLTQKPKGTFIDDFLFLARESNSNEEYTILIFQYGVTVGTSMAMKAAISHKN